MYSCFLCPFGVHDGVSKHKERERTLKRKRDICGQHELVALRYVLLVHNTISLPEVWLVGLATGLLI